MARQWAKSNSFMSGEYSYQNQASSNRSSANERESILSNNNSNFLMATRLDNRSSANERDSVMSNNNSNFQTVSRFDNRSSANERDSIMSNNNSNFQTASRFDNRSSANERDSIMSNNNSNFQTMSRIDNRSSANERDSILSNNNSNFLTVTRRDNRGHKNSPSMTSSVHNYSFVMSSPVSPSDDNRDQFTIYSSVKKRKSELTDSTIRYDSIKPTESKQINFKTLPAKQSSVGSNVSSGQFELNSSDFFSLQKSNRPTTLSGLLLNDETDQQNPVVEEIPVKADIQKQNFAAPPQEELLPDNNNAVKDQEIQKLNKTIEKLNKKLAALQKTNDENKVHLKNLLNERKNLIKQIENSEFEEIIEEEEVKKGNPNVIVKETITQHSPKEDLIRENFIDKTKLTIRDLPTHILNNYRKEIIEQEKEKCDFEKKALQDSLNFQWQKKYHSLKQELESRPVVEKQIFIETHTRKKFNQTVLECNLSRGNSPPVSVEKMTIQPVLSSKPLESEPEEEVTKKLAKETHQSFTKYLQRNNIRTTEWQNSILDRFTEYLEANDSERLSLLIKELLFKPFKTTLTINESVGQNKATQNAPVQDEIKTISIDLSKSLNSFLKKSQISASKWQTEVIDNFIKFLETKNSEGLSSLIQEILFRSTKSVEITTKPSMEHKQSQNETVEDSNSKIAKDVRTLFNQSVKKSKVTISHYQKSVIDRLLSSLESNNPQNISSLLEELFFKSSRNVGTNISPEFSTKSTQILNRYYNIINDVSIVEQKPVAEKSSKSISVKPNTVAKGTQPEEVFWFETGTMTDHLFYRSQGVMTVGDFTNNFSSPQSEIESYYTKTTNRMESKQEFSSRLSSEVSSKASGSPYKKSEHKIEKKIKPKSNDIVEEWEQEIITKNVSSVNATPRFMSTDLPTDSVDKSDQKIEIKRIETSQVTKPKQIIEEWEQKIEENCRVLTAHVDKDQNLKNDSETTVECWETVSKIKDGKLIEKKESYRDKFVSSNPEDIIKHLESHTFDHQHSHEVSPALDNFSSTPMSGGSFSLKSPDTIQVNQTTFTNLKNEDISDFEMNFSTDTRPDIKDIPINNKSSESSYETSYKTSIPIKKSTTETVSSDPKSPSKYSVKLPINVTKTEVQLNQETFSNPQLTSDVTMPERIQLSSHSKTKIPHNSMRIISSPMSFTSFSNRSTLSDFQSYSSSKEIESTSTPKINPKPKKVPSPLSIHSKEVKTIETNRLSPTKNTSDSLFNGSTNTTIIGSKNSAFYSISDQSKIVSTEKTEQKSGTYEVLLPENIFQYSNQVLLYLNTNKHLRLNSWDNWPQEMVKASTVLIDWWVDMVNKLNANELMTTIQYLISTFSKKFVKFLIINKDQQGNTCVHYIIGHQRWDSFSVLHSTGLVDPNIYNAQGYTVMMLASIQKVSEFVLENYIRKLAAVADLNLQSKEQGQTAIFLAAFHDCENIIFALHALGADINLRDNDDNTPLIISTLCNNINAVNAILSCTGVLTELKNKDGKTAIEIAIEKNFKEIIHLFEERKFKRHSEMSPNPQFYAKSFSLSSFKSSGNFSSN